MMIEVNVVVFIPTNLGCGTILCNYRKHPLKAFLFLIIHHYWNL